MNWWWRRIEERLDRIETLLKGIVKAMAAIDDAVNKVLADVTAETTEINSLETLAGGLQSLLAQAIAAAQSANPTADLTSLTQLSATLEAKTAEIHQAVLTNTASAAQLAALGVTTAPSTGS